MIQTTQNLSQWYTGPSFLPLGTKFTPDAFEIQIRSISAGFWAFLNFIVHKRSLLFLKEIGTEGRLERVSRIPSSSGRSGFKSEPAHELSGPAFRCFSQYLQADTGVSYTDFSLSWFDTPVGLDLLREVPEWHSFRHHSRYDSSGRVIGPSCRLLPYNTQYSQETDLRVPGGIRTCSPSKRVAVDTHLRSRGHWDRPTQTLQFIIH
jgi:hypothetical protein